MLAVAAEQFTPVDLIQLARPGIPVTSPNGTFAVYSQSAYNIEQAKVSLYVASAIQGCWRAAM